MKREFSYELYMNRTHWLGRIFSVLTLIMLTGAPFAIGGILGAMPDLAAAGKGFLAVGLVWTVSSIVAPSLPTPMWMSVRWRSAIASTTTHASRSTTPYRVPHAMDLTRVVWTTSSIRRA